jgi:hypothetical protein
VETYRLRSSPFCGAARVLALVALFSAAAGAMVSPTAAAADADADADVKADWQMSLRPYFFLSGLSGSVTAEPVTFPLNSSFSDLLDNLRPSAFVAFTAEKGAWGGYADLQYISLIAEATNVAGTSLELRNVIAEADVTYRPSLAPTLRFLAGARMYSVDQTLTIADQNAVEANTTVVDPILGAVGEWELSRRWAFEVRGDIGGFGAGSEFTHQLLALFHWHMSNTLSLPFGYRVLGYQIKTNDVWMNTRMDGLVVGLDIQF